MRIAAPGTEIGVARVGLHLEIVVDQGGFYGLGVEDVRLRTGTITNYPAHVVRQYGADEFEKAKVKIGFADIPCQIGERDEGLFFINHPRFLG
ncbi:hypothetical protein KEU06_23850 [Pseudaminobacter sp. 19-2017]|uniref:Uncharacterized protein n=1 Tax=Pseudaminobacter soli (ex Zhang et al. 2022) TaxID=2831468 RepID=A0A942E650_9HYPH|nr:hypothetical protein [Pseudaminobacter soli]MBS3651656.1 hypothetical protein [Pseudaminobacter soli]